MSIDNEILALLIELLKRIETICKEEHSKGHPAHNLYFSCDQAPVVDVYERLRDYFLVQETDERLSAFQGNIVYNPPWSRERLFAQNIELMLQWASVCFSRPPLSQSAEIFLEKFKYTFYLEPMWIAYIPIWGVAFKAGHIFEEVNLVQNKAKIILASYEESILINEHIKKKSNFELAIKVTSNTPLDVAMLAQSVRTIFLGLLGKHVYCHDILIGHRTPWHPWVFERGSILEEEPPHGNLEISDYEVNALAKQWPTIYPDILERYSITTNRYFMSHKRDNLEDRIIDLGVSLESLIEAEENIQEKLSTLIPLFIVEDLSNSHGLEELKKKICTFYELRSAIVHGNRKRLSKLTQILNRDGAANLCKEMEKSVRLALRALLLNQRIQTKIGQNKFRQKPSKLVRNP